MLRRAVRPASRAGVRRLVARPDADGRWPSFLARTRPRPRPPAGTPGARSSLRRHRSTGRSRRKRGSGPAADGAGGVASCPVSRSVTGRGIVALRSQPCSARRADREQASPSVSCSYGHDEARPEPGSPDHHHLAVRNDDDVRLGLSRRRGHGCNDTGCNNTSRHHPGAAPAGRDLAEGPAPAPPAAAPPASAPTTTTAPPPASAPPPPPLQVNHAPSFTTGPNQTILEDAGPQSSSWASSISAGPAAESAQSVSFSTVADNTGLFAVQPAVAPDGTLTYTPALNANGAATITVTAHDTGGTANGGTDASAPRTFTITIQSVNDAPSFNAGANQTVVSLLGAQTVGGWATGISPGPADEAGQSVSFVLTVSNPALFSVQPAVAPNGTLTYKPKALAIGTATVTIRAVDDGGTANGGQNTSVARTFTISIV